MKTLSLITAFITALALTNAFAQDLSRLSGIKNAHEIQATELRTNDLLNTVFNRYITLKDALVASDQKAASEAALSLVTALDEMPRPDLEHDVHTNSIVVMIWMKVLDPLKGHAVAIASISDLEEQRKIFKELSESMIALTKGSPRSTTIYLQHCPIYEGGSSWLSLE